MPGGDRTGPLGMGAMTGRGAGFCGGRGCRHRFYATGLTGWQRAGAGVPNVQPAPQPAQEPSPEQELQTLKAEAEAAAASLEHIRQRIDELAGKASAPTAGQ